MYKLIIVSGSWLSFLLSTPCVYAAESENQLGVVHLAVSEKNPEAKDSFLKGLLLLHSFQYDEARVDFESAQKLDPEFAMAYWGEVMTYNHPVWNEQNYAAANDVLTKLAPTSEGRLIKAQTPLEKGFINAVNKLYGSGSKLKRDDDYESAMHDLYAKFPDSEEVGAFYALSILGSTQGTRSFKNYMQAAGILEELYQDNPKHPGVIHYLIHTYDDPIHAPLGLRFARMYAKIAPDSPHALHMPSHIYLALGMWDDVVNSNLAAWNAGVVEKNHSGNYDVHALHALQWLSYGYLQLKDNDMAYQQVKIMEQIVKLNPNDAMSKWYYSLMRAVYMSDTQNWNVDLSEIDLSGIEMSAVADNAYVQGMQAIKNKNSKKALQIIENTYRFSKTSTTKVGVETACHNDANYFNTLNDGGIVIVKIVYFELKAQNALANLNQAIQFAKQAADIENSLSFGYGPPLPAKPANELLAELYLQNKQYVLAYKQFLISLEHTPNRTISKEGLQKTINKLNTLKITIPQDSQKPYFNKLM